MTPAEYRELKRTGRFIHCGQCVEEDTRTNYEVAVVKDGDLVLWCRRHDRLITHFKNDEIAEALRQASEAGCALCQIKIPHGH